MVKAPRPSPSADLPPSSALPGDDAVAEATLAVADSLGWRRTTLAAVAAHLGVPVARVVAVAASRFELLRLVFRHIDRRMLEGVTAADELEPHRDRLFDLVMRRLEVLAPHRAAVESVARTALGDPGTALAVATAAHRSATLMLEAAGISTQGAWGEMRVQVFAGVFLRVLRVWRDDDTADLSHTMKALDKALDQAVRAEHFACALVPRSVRRSARGGEPPATAPDDAASGPETPGAAST